MSTYCKLATIAALGVYSATLWAAPQTIVLIESYHSGYAWDRDYKATLTKRLADRYKLESFEMDTKRLPKEKHAEMADKAFAKIQELKPVLVILGDDAALKLVGPKLDKLGTPGVYLGVNNNPRAYGSFNNITGVLERPLMKRNIPLIEQLQPGVRKVLVMFDSDTTAEVTRSEVFEGKDSYSLGRVQVDVKLHKTYDEWKKSIQESKQNGYEAIITGLYQALRDGSGKAVDAGEVISWTSSQTPLPLYGFWDFTVGADKAMGGLVLSPVDQANAAADIVMKILVGGSKPATIFPVTAPNGDYLFSRKQLERFHLKLPVDIAGKAKLID